MIPESVTDGKVQLLRCGRFPDDGQLERVLCEGVSLLDATPYHLDDNGYFFTCTTENHLFYSPTLEGRWVSHPANPICSDIGHLRNAGALFR